MKNRPIIVVVMLLAMVFIGTFQASAQHRTSTKTYKGAIPEKEILDQAAPVGPAKPVTEIFK